MALVFSNYLANLYDNLRLGPWSSIIAGNSVPMLSYIMFPCTFLRSLSENQFVACWAITVYFNQLAISIQETNSLKYISSLKSFVSFVSYITKILPAIHFQHFYVLFAYLLRCWHFPFHFLQLLDFNLQYMSSLNGAFLI